MVDTVVVFPINLSERKKKLLWKCPADINKNTAYHRKPEVTFLAVPEESKVKDSYKHNMFDVFNM